MKVLKVLALVAVFQAIISWPSHAAGVSVWKALSISAGAQQVWLDDVNGNPTSKTELALNGALGVSQHIAVTGGGSYGFDGGYARSFVDARITATDAADPTFSAWIGAGRYFCGNDNNGLDEWAAKAGVGWQPFAPPVLVGVTAAYGLDTSRKQLTAAVVWRFKKASGGGQ